MAKKKDGYTIKEAAQALGVSTKTIRRLIDKGTLGAKLQKGKYGPEYQIAVLPGEKQAAEPIDRTLDQALDLVSRLQAENRDLAGALGTAQERVRSLESQVLLLTAGKRPWWKRLFRQAPGSA